VASRLASFAAGTIEALAARIGISEPAQAWLGRHPTPPEFTLLTDLESCVACGGSLSLATNQSVPPNSTVVVVYSATCVCKAEILQKRCSCCCALHYYSYATGGTLLGDNVRASKVRKGG